MAIEVLKICVWAAAFVVITSIFFLIFPRPIRELIGRIKSIGRKGIDTSLIQPHETIEKEPAEELMRAFDSVVLRERENLISKDLKERGVTDLNEVRNILIRHLAAFQLVLQFEVMDKYIYGSQIKLLEYLNSKLSGAPIKEVEVFYSIAAEVYPELYKEYPFEKYLAFLSSHTLIVSKENRYFITNLGREFLSYLMRTGKPLVRSW